MSSAQRTAVQPASTAALRSENAALQEQVESLKTQLDWFKRQLFGSKSEKRLLIDPTVQADLLAGLNAVNPEAPLPASETMTYERRKSRGDKTVTDSGLRFDDSVPVETIELLSPYLDGVPDSERTVIGEKTTYRLAQRPGSYVVLKYVRQVIKRKHTTASVTPAAPAAVLDKSVADVSFLAGLLVDKFVYHLPLYRQHQRLQQSGIQLSRSTLTTLASRAIDLLTPIFHTQFGNILQSRVLAMDETPIKAGRKHKGKLRQAYFWPIYGEADEIAFSYSPSRASAHVREVLCEAFRGVLVSDGNEAYARYAQTRWIG